LFHLILLRKKNWIDFVSMGGAWKKSKKSRKWF
jgi:hypothetical protein